jgi:sugar/nucleoside kinase (ribokinase family)
MVNWDEVFRGVKLFHVGGITPVLSASAYETQKEAMIAARNAGCLVSYEVNYRAALWTIEEARKAQLRLMEYVDIFITSLPDQPNISELLSGLNGDDPETVAQKVADKFGDDAHISFCSTRIVDFARVC